MALVHRLVSSVQARRKYARYHHQEVFSTFRHCDWSTNLCAMFWRWRAAVHPYLARPCTVCSAVLPWFWLWAVSASDFAHHVLTVDPPPPHPGQQTPPSVGLTSDSAHQRMTCSLTLRATMARIRHHVGNPHLAIPRLWYILFPIYVLVEKSSACTSCRPS